ncbi:MAG: hypothetical protein ACTHJL_11490 [Amnibacterium sp.]
MLWVIDGLLQLQPSMFTSAFARDVLAGSASGNPGWIAASIRWAASVVGSAPILGNGAFAALQLAIGIGILWRRTTAVAFGVSIAWSLGVWWFGEGLGGLLSGPANALTGAPGAALLYALRAVLLWPPTAARGEPFAAAGLIGAAAARGVWLVVWAGLAALNLEPGNLRADGLSASVRDAGSGQPAWLRLPGSGFGAFSEHNGLLLTLLGAAVLAAVAFGILLPAGWSRTAVIGAGVVSLFIWAVGEAFGAPFGGQATDPDSGPLLVLFALAYWPTNAGGGAGHIREPRLAP